MLALHLLRRTTSRRPAGVFAIGRQERPAAWARTADLTCACGFRCVALVGLEDEAPRCACPECGEPMTEQAVGTDSLGVKRQRDEAAHRRSQLVQAATRDGLGREVLARMADGTLDRWLVTLYPTTPTPAARPWRAPTIRTAAHADRRPRKQVSA